MTAVVFDIGGVLAKDVWENMLVLGKNNISEQYNLEQGQLREIGDKLWNEFAYKKAETLEDVEKFEVHYWETFIKHFNINVTPHRLIEQTDDFIVPISGMEAILKRLAEKGIPLGICSDNTEFWFRRQAQKMNLEKYISLNNIVLSCHVGVSKSSPNFELFKTVTKRLGVEKKDCLFIDDRPEKIYYSLEYGMTGILFPSQVTFGSKYLTQILDKIGIF